MSEFQLFIHASQKERAKAIDGRRWDMNRRCWLYPKTARVFDAIIAEFGDDMVSCLAKRPSVSSSAQAVALQQENEYLHADLEKIHRTLELISKGADNDSRTEVQALQAALASRQSELSEVRKRLHERDNEIETLKKALTDAQGQVNRLSGENAVFQGELAKRKGASANTAPHLGNLLKEVAIEAAGCDPKFVALADRLRLNETLPNELVKQLERELRRILATDDRTLSLHDLITMAKDAELLTEKAIDLAHTIRRHRNIRVSAH